MGALTAPSAWAAPPKTQWLILAHLDGRGGLTEAVRSYEQQLRQAAASLGFTVALEVVPDGSPPRGSIRRVLLRPGRPAQGLAVTPGGSAAETLYGLVAWATAQQPSDHVALLVMGHGAGLLEGGVSLPADAMRPPMICQALQRAREQLGRSLDVLCLDTCYGASLEVLYGFSGLCRYVTAAPGLVYSPGLDWAGALSDLARSPQTLVLVRGLVTRGMPLHRASLALVGVDLQRMPAVCEMTRQLSDELQGRLTTELATLTWARAHSPSWGDRAELVDLATLASQLHGNAATPEVRQMAGELSEALVSLVTVAWSNDSASSPGGVGVFFPPTLSETPPEYSSAYEFARASDWAPLLESYWSAVTQMLTVPTP